jgi:DNA-binding transcriptional MerR regulator
MLEDFASKEAINNIHIEDELSKFPEKTYRIGEVSSMLGVKEHVVRYWEKEFRDFLNFKKTSGGHRLYTYKDVKNFINIKEMLYGEGYNIEGAIRQLKKNRFNKPEKNISKDSFLIIKEDILKLKNSIDDTISELSEIL